jgi:DeoR/GlpR family transcriptional regulator of sugar metabolism
MGKGHWLVERRQAILAALEDAGQLSVADLCERFGVSEVTIRTDLRALSQQGLLQRTRGGTLASHILPELSFGVRQQQRAQIKTCIGQAAADLVNPGDAIAIDASTTALAITPWLRKLPELTVVTNSLKVAMSLLNAPHIQVIMPGGALRRESISLVGLGQDAFLDDYHVQLVFVGARGLTMDKGLTDVSPDEVMSKKAMIAHGQRLVGLVDSYKWGQAATATFATLPQIDTLITDAGAPPDLIEGVRCAGVHVIVVHPE